MATAPMGEKAHYSPAQSPGTPMGYQQQPLGAPAQYQQPVASPPMQQAQPVYSPHPQQPQQHAAPVLPAAGGPNRAWEHDMFDCFEPTDTCCMGYWCPCILYGKTHARMKDPSLQNYSMLNGSCCGWYCLAHCGLFWVLQMINRGDIRSKYHLDGSTAGDCLRSYCCACCSLIQEEKEVVARQKEQAAMGAQGYKPVGQQMQYPGH